MKHYSGLIKYLVTIIVAVTAGAVLLSRGVSDNLANAICIILIFAGLIISAILEREGI